jgi:hypothetical protein
MFCTTLALRISYRDCGHEVELNESDSIPRMSDRIPMEFPKNTFPVLKKVLLEK